MTDDFSSNATRIIHDALRGMHNIKISGGSAFIPCPFHPNDTNPSLGINLDEGNGIPIGYVHCLGCRAKGPWNKLAEKLGLQLIEVRDYKKDNIPGYDFTSLNNELLGLQNNLEYFMELLGIGLFLDWPETEAWRNIPGHLLSKINGKMCYDKVNQDRGIILPVSVNNTLRGVILGTNTRKKTSYIMNSGPWVKNYGLFPYDYTVFNLPTKKTITLVEGVRDALRLLRYGIPAIAILGSQNWSKTKLDLLLSLNLHSLILAFDGDRAGIEATNHIYHDVKNLIKTRVFKMKHYSKELGMKIDPGNAPKYVLRELKTLVDQ